MVGDIESIGAKLNVQGLLLGEMELRILEHAHIEIGNSRTAKSTRAFIPESADGPQGKRVRVEVAIHVPGMDTDWGNNIRPLGAASNPRTIRRDTHGSRQAALEGCDPAYLPPSKQFSFQSAVVLGEWQAINIVDSEHICTVE